MMNFEDARQRALETTPAGIGTLGEKTLHATLKWWLDDHPHHHEITLPEGPVADIFDTERVTEIQTANFSGFRGKLERLLEAYPVTVVHPVVMHKWLVWIDPITGEATAPHPSTRPGRLTDACRELIYILPLLAHPHLTVTLVPVDVEERRLADGRRSRDGKRGSHRLERWPLAVGRPVTLTCAADYRQLLPPGLTSPFTAKDFARAARMQGRALGGALKVLMDRGVIARTGKNGNAWTYEIRYEI